MVIIGRAVASRLEVPEAVVLVVLVVLGVLARLIPQVPNIDLPPDLVLLLFLPPLIYNAQRDKLDDLYRTGKITDEVRRTIARTLDLQEPRPFHYSPLTFHLKCQVRNQN